MSERGAERLDGDHAPAGQLGAAAVRQMGLARGLEWTLDEAPAIRDQLVSTHEGLRLAEVRIGATAEEPASKFKPGGEG